MAQTEQLEDLYSSAGARRRYEAYSRLQAAAVAFGEQVPIPEIVAIGGQSDGKSSLLEALLGFRFNVREVEMGTRRPLIVQMQHDPACPEPRCRLQEEEGTAYGPPLAPSAVCEAILRRTEAHLAALEAAVSSKPVVLRVEYAHCATLTLIDTPGFVMRARQGESAGTPEEIAAMVREQCAPRHRLILFLQQSSVEWASSLWMHVVQELDPQFERTIVVSSKFDNRLKEFSHRAEVDQYLAAAGYLPANVRPFFVALPKDRGVSASCADWRRAIQEVDARVFETLTQRIEGGYDAERFASRVGFASLKRYLETEMAARYRQAAPATLSALQKRHSEALAELAEAERSLGAVQDVAALRKAGMEHVLDLMALLEASLSGEGSALGCREAGLTTEEERALAEGMGQWPGLRHAPVPPGAEFRLAGKAAMERCMAELRQAILAVGFPAVSRDRVANVLLAGNGQWDSSAGQRLAAAAGTLVRAEAGAVLEPLLGAAARRLGAVARRAYAPCATEALARDPAAAAALQSVGFRAALQSGFEAYVAELEAEAARVGLHHVRLATASRGWDAECLGWGADDAENEGGEHTPRAAALPNGRERLPLTETQMTVPETPSPEGARSAEEPEARRGGRRAKSSRLGQAGPGGGAGARDPLVAVAAKASSLFHRLQGALANGALPAALRSVMLGSLRADLGRRLLVGVCGRPDGELLGLFADPEAVQALRRRQEELAERVSMFRNSKDEFAALAQAL